MIPTINAKTDKRKITPEFHLAFEVAFDLTINSKASLRFLLILLLRGIQLPYILNELFRGFRRVSLNDHYRLVFSLF